MIDFKEYLDYCERTGVFTWKKSTGRRNFIGKVAGSTTKDGYIRINVKGKSYAAHRLAWWFKNGVIPDHPLDHINRDRGDNRIENLRAASNMQNGYNRAASITNSSGYKGVYSHNIPGKWRAIITANGIRYELGIYDCIHEAAQVYNYRAYKLHGEYAYFNTYNQGG